MAVMVGAQAAHATPRRGVHARACWRRTWAKAVSTVCTTLEEVQVMVGTTLWASALVFRLVLMYTTCGVGWRNSRCGVLRRVLFETALGAAGGGDEWQLTCGGATAAAQAAARLAAGPRRPHVQRVGRVPRLCQVGIVGGALCGLGQRAADGVGGHAVHRHVSVSRLIQDGPHILAHEVHAQHRNGAALVGRGAGGR